MKPTSENVGFWLVYTIIRIYSTTVWFIYAVSGNLFLNFIFSKENDSNFAFKKYILPLRSIRKHLHFYFRKGLLSRLLERNSFWRIFLQRKNLRKLMSFMTLKNIRAKALAKNFKKHFHGFSMFFKFKRSIFSSILRFFFLLFFYSFVCAVIT